jgi:hypothetical protein
MMLCMHSCNDAAISLREVDRVNVDPEPSSVLVVQKRDLA